MMFDDILAMIGVLAVVAIIVWLLVLAWYNSEHY